MNRLRDNIFALEVPLWSTQHELYNISDYTMIKFPAPWGWGRLSILKEDYKIIGTITAANIDFDPKPYLISHIIDGDSSFEVFKFFDNLSYTEDAEAAFRSVFYYFYMPDHLSFFEEDNWPDFDWNVKGKLLLLEMVNFKPL